MLPKFSQYLTSYFKWLSDMPNTESAVTFSVSLYVLSIVCKTYYILPNVWSNFIKIYLKQAELCMISFRISTLHFHNYASASGVLVWKCHFFQFSQNPIFNISWETAGSIVHRRSGPSPDFTDLKLLKLFRDINPFQLYKPLNVYQNNNKLNDVKHILKIQLSYISFWKMFIPQQSIWWWPQLIIWKKIRSCASCQLNRWAAVA